VKLHTLLCLAVAGSGLFTGSASRAGLPQGNLDSSPRWQQPSLGSQGIVYPPLPIPGAERDRLHVGVAREELVGAPGNVGAASHMRFNVTWGGSRSNMPKAISSAANIHVELHTADGKVALSERLSAQWIGASGGGNDATWYLV
jgi:hypothetical protein